MKDMHTYHIHAANFIGSKHAICPYEAKNCVQWFDSGVFKLPKIYTNYTWQINIMNGGETPPHQVSHRLVHWF